MYRSSTSWPCPTDSGVEVTCNVQINYPTAEAALAGKGGTVGQFGYSIETADVPKGKLQAVLRTLAVAAGALCYRSNTEGLCVWQGWWEALHAAAAPAAAARLVQCCAVSCAADVWLPASDAADEMTRKGWEGGPENDI